MDDPLPPLRDVIEAHDLKARKGLGQNFLLDLNITRKIARLAEARPGVPFVEVGPGPGGLTRALLASGVDQLFAIEKDNRVQPVLDQIALHYPEAFSYLIGDALSFDWSFGLKTPYEVVANLPYNIGTALLTDWLCLSWPLPFKRLTLMFQEEVAERIVAGPGTRAYGRLSVLVGWRTHAEIIYRLPRSAFTPPPKVTSAVVQLTVRDELEHAPSPDMIARVTAAAFGQRRKMLRTSLRPIAPDCEALLACLDIDPTARAEMISVADYCRIAKSLMKA